MNAWLADWARRRCGVFVWNLPTWHVTYRGADRRWIARFWLDAAERSWRSGFPKDGGDPDGDV